MPGAETLPGFVLSGGRRNMTLALTMNLLTILFSMLTLIVNIIVLSHLR